MGLFSKAKKGFGKVAGSAKFGVVGGAANLASGGKLDQLTGGLLGSLKGKDKTYKADPLAAGINNLGAMGVENIRAGAEELSKVYANPQESINNQIGIENKLMRGATEDATRRTRDLIAQRGMGGSSIGLGQEINQGKMLSDKLAMNNASGMNRLMDMNKERMNIGNSLLAPKLKQGIQMNSIKQRQGGMGQLFGTLAGAGVGAAVGGPAGAGIGSKLGGAVGGYYQNS